MSIYKLEGHSLVYSKENYMIKGRLKDLSAAVSKINVNEILNLAKRYHENYLIRSSEKDLDNAILYYLEVIKIEPSMSEAYCKLASLMLEKGDIDIDSALEECSKAKKLDLNSSAASLYSGYFLKADGRFDEAEAEFKSAIELNGFLSAKPRIALGATIIEKLHTLEKFNFKEFLRGMYYFCSGIMMISFDSDIVRLICKSILEDIRVLFFKFNGSLYKNFKNYEKAVKVYENAAESTGRINMFYSEIGDLSIESGNYPQAVKYYKKSLESSPDNAVLWAKLADILQRNYIDNIDEIKDCYDHLLELEPTNAAIYYELGHLYLKLEDKFSTVNAFKRAVEIEPDNAYYHNSLAYSLIQLEDYDAAINEYQKAIKLNPDNQWTSIVSQALGAIYHQIKNNHDAAIVAYQTAVILDPLNVDVFIALGEVYQGKNDFTNAIECYCEAIKLDPEIPRVYHNLGMALWEKDYIDEAIMAYHKAITLDPQYESALNNLGVVYLDGAGKPDEALINFTRAIKCNPNFALAYYNKGRAYSVLNNKTDAAKYYQMAIDINKFTEELDEIEIENRLYEMFSVD